jgi:hypothetical protein
MNSPQLTPEQQAYVKQAKAALHLGFITHLQHAGRAEIVKAASAGGADTIAHSDFTDGQVEFLFQKYAQEWVPHREQLTAGYLNAIFGNEQAAA